MLYHGFPRASIGAFRIFGEALVDLLLKEHHLHSDGNCFYEKLQVLKEDWAHLNVEYSQLLDELDSIRKIGKNGAHPIPISEADSKDIWKAAVKAAELFFKNYSNDDNREDAKFRYALPSVENTVPLSRSEKQEIEKEFMGKIELEWEDFWKHCAVRFVELGLKCEFNVMNRYYLELKRPLIQRKLVSSTKGRIKIELVCVIAEKYLRVNIIVYGNEQHEHEEIASGLNEWIANNGEQKLLSNEFPAWNQESPRKTRTKYQCAILDELDNIDPDDAQFREFAFDWYAKQVKALQTVFAGIIK
jgi:hypothetical protein